MFRAHTVARLAKRLAAASAIVAAAMVPIATSPHPAGASTEQYVGSAASPSNDGYWLVTGDGRVMPRGSVRSYGDLAGVRLNAGVISIASTASGKGYWILASDGGVFSFGDAAFYGSTGSMRLNKPVVGMSTTKSGRGYWLVASDGGIFTFGDASFYGSTGSMRLNKPIVNMAATRDGHGYWLLATDGGIFTFGNAGFFGSTGSLVLNRPVIAMSPTLSDQGYWLAGADGGIFTFGDATFAGSSAGPGVTAISVIADSTGGYSLVHQDGSVDNRSTSPVNTPPSTPITPPSNGGNPTPPNNGVTANWRLRSEENFNGNALSQPRWPIYDGLAGGNAGRYTPSTMSVKNGALTINSVGTSVGGTCWCDGTGSQTYGKWEIRARMTNSEGQWPAILLWPDSEHWPIDGEIDIAEFASGVRNSSSFTVHYGTNNSQIQHSDAGDFTQWHTFAVDWQPNYIRYYLDNQLRYEITDRAAIPHTPMHLALQTNSGDGSWMAKPADNVRSTFEVDWARIYLP